MVLNPIDQELLQFIQILGGMIPLSQIIQAGWSEEQVFRLVEAGFLTIDPGMLVRFARS
jgi:hypothetical protein